MLSHSATRYSIVDVIRDPFGSARDLGTSTDTYFSYYPFLALMNLQGLTNVTWDFLSSAVGRDSY